MSPKIALLGCLIAVGLVGLIGKWFPDLESWAILIGMMIVVVAIGISSKSLASLICELESTRASSPGLGDISAEMHSMHVVMNRFPDCTLPTTTWTMRFANLHALSEFLDERQPHKIVEFGSGLSTILIAAWLRESGRGRLITFDHDHEWAAKTQKHLDRAKLNEFVTVSCVPLVDTMASGRQVVWYDCSFDDWETESIDFVVVDGPPGHLSGGGISRLPVIEKLRPFLSTEYCIVLDDANRKGELDILRLWQEDLSNCRLVLHNSYTGLACLVNNPRPVIVERLEAVVI